MWSRVLGITELDVQVVKVALHPLWFFNPSLLVFGKPAEFCSLLGGSWVVISGVIRPLIWVITIVTLLITPLVTTHEPPSTGAHTCIC